MADSPSMYFVRLQVRLGSRIDKTTGYRILSSQVELWAGPYPTLEAATAASEAFINHSTTFGGVTRAGSEQQRREWEAAARASSADFARVFDQARSDYSHYLDKYWRWSGKRSSPWWKRPFIR
jgi:hypothetical protein